MQGITFQTMANRAANAQLITVSSAKALKSAQNVAVDITYNLIL